MKFNRSSGILLHPVSFPGVDGIGDLGPDAYQWLQTLYDMRCGLWQILPLGPTGYGDSPYQCFSAFAGNPYLINPLYLVGDGLLDLTDLDDRPEFPDEYVDYGPAILWKLKLLERAFERFQTTDLPNLKTEFTKFQSDQSAWLDDFALFMSIKNQQKGKSWKYWPVELKRRDKKALEQFKKQFPQELQKQTFNQFLFFRQWNQLHEFAHQKGIKIVGDIPIFVAFDSADAWSHPELFYFDDQREPTVVAGVPPDYFSPTGQLWGNPLYRWDVHEKSGFAWWIERVKATLEMVDYIRLDHFRGFVDYWEIPANMPTAEIGEWKPGPGISLFTALKNALGHLPIIAEDLGQINPNVYELRDQLELPGMKILQFAFGSDSDDPFLPHNYTSNCVAYTGTHDNDTTFGWYENAGEVDKNFCRRYLSSTGENICRDMIRCIWSSVAVMALSPLQDFLKKDTTARMNFPGKPSGNWLWRYKRGEITESLIAEVRELNFLYGRTLETQ